MKFKKDKKLTDGVIRKGKFFALPFEGESIFKTDRFLSTFFFKIAERIVILKVNSNYIISINGEVYKADELREDFFDFLIPLIKDMKVLKARTDKYGELEITLEEDIIIKVEDGPFENWHYEDKINRIYLHGGCGRFI